MGVHTVMRAKKLKAQKENGNKNGKKNGNGKKEEKKAVAVKKVKKVSK